jgi:hypothetical protein
MFWSSRDFGDCLNRDGILPLVDEVDLDGENGRHLRLSNPTPWDSEDIWSYDAELSLAEVTVRTTIWDHGDQLARFLRQLADGWAGFDGVMEFSSLEGQLALSCRHDGRGTVECRVTLGRLNPPFWRLQADGEFGAGAHLERLASDAEAFLTRR